MNPNDKNRKSIHGLPALVMLLLVAFGTAFAVLRWGFDLEDIPVLCGSIIFAFFVLGLFVVSEIVVKGTGGE